MDVLVNRIQEIERAAEFASKVNVNEVWSKLG